MKRFTAILLSIIVLIAAFPMAMAASNHVIDQAGILDEASQAELNDRAQTIAANYGIDAVIVTVNSLHGKSAQDYADDYFDTNGFGAGSDNSGVLLLVAMQERQWYISTHAEGVDALTYDEIGELEREMVSDLSAGEFDQAFSIYLQFLETEFSEYRSGDRGLTVRDVIVRLVIALVISVVIAWIVLLVMRSRMNTAKSQVGASQYMVGNSYDLFRIQDIFLYSRTTKSAKAQDSTNSTHHSSSGRSHGGRGGNF